MNVEMRPPVKRWINGVIGWDATTEIERSMEEEDLEDVEEIIESMREWDVDGITPEEFNKEIQAHREEMINKGGEMKESAMEQRTYLRKMNEADNKGVELTWQEMAEDIEHQMRMTMKEIVAHAARARKLRQWKSAITSHQIEVGGNHHVDLNEISEDVKEKLMSQEHDELNPQMELADEAVDQTLENAGIEGSREAVREKAREMRENGEEEVDFGISDEEFEQIKEDSGSEVSEMFENEV